MNSTNISLHYNVCVLNCEGQLRVKLELELFLIFSTSSVGFSIFRKMVVLLMF